MASRSRSLPPCLVLLAVVTLVYPPTAHAQRDDFDIPPWSQHRIYGVSTGGPMLRHMLRQPSFNATSAMFLAYIAHVEQAILGSLGNATRPRADRRFTPCTGAKKWFSKSIHNVFGIRGLPDPTYDCLTDVIGTQLFADEPPLYSIEQLGDAVESYTNLVDREKDALIRDVLLKWPPHTSVLANWTTAARSLNEWERDNKRCTIGVVGFIRVLERWFLNIGVDNAPNAHALPKWKRQKFGEYVYIGPNGQDAQALRQRLPTYVNDTFDGPPMENTTTVFLRTQGRGWPSFYYRVYPEENPAMLEAMEKADLPVRQAIDALSPSTLAILFLPIVLNLVPIALITPVETKVMLIYMLCSDFLTVVPLFIKGVELVVIGRQRFRAVALRIENDLNGAVGNGAAGQLWTAECRTLPTALRHGIAFVVVSVLAFGGGVLLELWAQRFVRDRQQQRRELQAEYWRIGADEMYETNEEARVDGRRRQKNQRR